MMLFLSVLGKILYFHTAGGKKGRGSVSEHASIDDFFFCSFGVKVRYSCIRKEDISGIASCVFTKNGQGEEVGTNRDNFFFFSV